MKRIRSLIDALTATENTNRIALLGAFSMFLSTIEYLFPKPVPFMRLGLANLPLLLGLEVLSAPSYFLLVIIKVLGQALVNGTLASYVFLFSLGGSLASAVVMRLCYMLPERRISFIGISLMGALASNIVQIMLSVQFVFGQAAWRILPAFLGIGLASGFFIGIFAVYFSASSLWWRAFSGKPAALDPAQPAAFLNTGRTARTARTGKSERAGKTQRTRRRRKRKDFIGEFISPGFRFWTGLVMIPAWLFLREPAVKTVFLAVFILLAVLAGKRIRLLYFLILTASITVFHLLMPSGRVLYEIAGLKITEGALQTGLMKALTLCGLIMLSLFSVSGRLRLPGRLGGLLAGTFYYFEEILEGRGRIVPGRLIASIDQILMDIFPESALKEPAVNRDIEPAGRTNIVINLFYSLVLATGLWITLFWQFF